MLNINLNILKLNFLPVMFTLKLWIIIIFIINLIWNHIIIFLLIFFIIFFIYIIYFFLLKLNIENNFIGLFSKKKHFININAFIIFIISEAIIFISLFWSYIHNAYCPNQFIGNYWPPKGLIPSNPTGIIIFGTVILLSSSFIITISHNNIINKNNKIKRKNLFLIILIIGLIFIDIQILEIRNFLLKLQFNFNDRIFRNSFLITTSLHASHVFLGILGLILRLIYYIKNYNDINYFSNLEISIWYWHFVDYIWIIVFSLFYYFNS